VIQVAGSPVKKTMRDVFLGEVLAQMNRGEKVVFLSADFGAPVLDQIRADHPDRFINIGIAEQNLINVGTGMALEGFTVYAYAIAPFITMRCCEQIRVNLAILSQIRAMNINLIGVGAGFSYEVSGPTHHCLEDISIMRTFPNFEIFSPSDWATAGTLAGFCLANKGPKYLRFDAKPLPPIHEAVGPGAMGEGFIELESGGEVCLVATGFLTHKAQEVCRKLAERGEKAGLIDFFRLKGFDEDKLCAKLAQYKKVVTLEEGFTGKGGMDALVREMVVRRGLKVEFKAMGLDAKYIFHIGGREYLHKKNDLGMESIMREAQ
jgi:transketolase